MCERAASSRSMVLVSGHPAAARAEVEPRAVVLDRCARASPDRSASRRRDRERMPDPLVTSRAQCDRTPDLQLASPSERQTPRHRTDQARMVERSSRSSSNDTRRRSTALRSHRRRHFVRARASRRQRIGSQVPNFQVNHDGPGWIRTNDLGIYHPNARAAASCSKPPTAEARYGKRPEFGPART